MKNLQRYLQQIADARRRELLPYIFEKTGGLVQIGPFQGLAIVPKTMWGDGDTAAKLLGQYENELHDFVEHAVATDPDLILNIGCAEGYYSTGLARRLPAVPVIAVDMDARSAPIVNDNAMANQLSNVTVITQQVDHAWLQQNTDRAQRPFLVFDCEGAELDLLDPAAVPALHKATMLVECHDCIIPNLTKTLQQRFEHTHEVRAVDQTYKDSYQFDFLRPLSDCDKWCLVHEGRPSTMTWLYMTPRT